MLGRLLHHAALHHLVDVGIALVGDDALGIVVHLVLAVLNVSFQVLGQLAVQLQLGDDLLVSLEQLDGVPAQVLLIHLALNGLFDVCNGVLHAAGEHMRQLAHLVGLGSGGGLFGCFHTALALQGADLHHLAAQLGGQLLHVDLVAVLADQVHHVHGHHNGQAQLQQLGGQVQVALDVGAVHDVQDGVGLLLHQIAAGHNLFQGVGAQAVNAGQVLNDHVLVALQLAFLLFNGNAGPVANVLVGTGQIIEQGGLAAVRVAGKSNGNAHSFHSSVLNAPRRAMRPALFVSLR